MEAACRAGVVAQWLFPAVSGEEVSATVKVEDSDGIIVDGSIVAVWPLCCRVRRQLTGATVREAYPDGSYVTEGSTSISAAIGTTDAHPRLSQYRRWLRSRLSRLWEAACDPVKRTSERIGVFSILPQSNNLGRHVPP